MAGLTPGYPHDVVVLDASVVIALLDGSDAHHDAAVALLSDQAASTFVTSSLTYGEILVGPARHHRLEEAAALLEAIGLESLEVPADAGSELAALRAATGARMPDCCVLLTARRRGGSVATFDGRLRAAARSLGLSVL